MYYVDPSDGKTLGYNDNVQLCFEKSKYTIPEGYKVSASFYYRSLGSKGYVGVHIAQYPGQCSSMIIHDLVLRPELPESKEFLAELDSLAKFWKYTAVWATVTAEGSKTALEAGGYKEVHSLVNARTGNKVSFMVREIVHG